MQLVWQRFACVKAAILVLAGVYSYVGVYGFRVGVNPSREASVLNRPSVEGALRIECQFACTHTQTYLCFNTVLHYVSAHHSIKILHQCPEGCIRTESGAHENAITLYQQAESYIKKCNNTVSMSKY